MASLIELDGHPYLWFRLLAFVTTLFFLRITYNALTGPVARLPGTNISKWTDLPVRWRTLTGTRAKYVHLLHEKYGPVVRTGPRDVDVSDVDAVREIHRVRNPFRKSDFYGPAGAKSSMFATRDPEFHSQRRRLLGPQFTDTSLASFELTAKSLIESTVQGLLEEMNRSGHTDVLKWWTLMAMDVIAELTFGESFGMVRSGLKTQFAEDVGQFGSILPLRSAFPFIFTVGAYLPWVPFFHNIVLSRQRIMKVQQARVARCMELARSDNNQRKKSILGALVNKTEGTDLKPMEMMIEAQSFITAGTDTTAVTMTYLIWSVCKDEVIKEYILKELQSLPENFSHSDLKPLPYLNAVIDEALRCYGAAPGSLPRVVPEGGAELADHTIPGGVTVTTQAYSLHRDPKIFQNPTTFDPSRWKHPTKIMLNAFMPFGIGPRGCVGVHLARMELRLATAIFFRTVPNVRISTQEDMSDKDMEPKISFLLMPKGHRCLVEMKR